MKPLKYIKIRKKSPDHPVFPLHRPKPTISDNGQMSVN